MKKVFVVHCWGCSAHEGWYPWLKEKLEERGNFEVELLEMPDADHPRIETWVPHLAAVVGEPDRDTILVGHSIGCQTILRYLDSLEQGQKIGGVVLVAGWFKLTSVATRDPEDREIAMPWIKTPINAARVRNRTGKIVVILSDDDPYVPLENKEYYEKNLKAKVIIESGKKHLGAEHGIEKLPSVLKAVIGVSKKGKKK